VRRLGVSTDGERGGIAVIVAILMVVMLGFAALAIDVAKLYAERAQLQNGSDAAALMMAQKCAKE
jgi:Flp pilus assembly protein TadG